MQAYIYSFKNTTKIVKNCCYMTIRLSFQIGACLFILL